MAFLTALALSLVLTRQVRGLAWRLGLVDHPEGERRSHAAPVPRVGGIAVFAAVSIGLLALPALVSSLWPASVGEGRVLLAIGLGAAAVFGLGLWDDARGLPARLKFLFEVAVALAVYAAGVRIGSIHFGGAPVELPAAVDIVLTTLWLVGITNAFNLIDGSDGVAAGAALFASVSMAAVLTIAGQPVAAAAALALAGATLGFLFFNFPPATIFLGDCGSLFIGFSLAGLGLVTAQDAPTTLAVAIPVVCFGLPILDTVLAVARRFLRSEPIFNPDRGHIHHRLRELGHSPRAVALSLYAVCAAFSLLSLMLMAPEGAVVPVLFLVAGTSVWIGVQRLRVPELVEVERVVSRGLRQRKVIASNLRVVRAAESIRRAETPAEFFAALENGVDLQDFEQVELWLDWSVAGPLYAERLVQKCDAGFRWLRHGDELPPAASGGWYIRFPLLDGDGRRIGSLSLWPASASEHVLTDMQVIARHLRPALTEALARLGARGAQARGTGRGQLHGFPARRAN